jgi:hypothetical protein
MPNTESEHNQTMLLAITALEILHLIAGAEEQQANKRQRYVYEEQQENWRIDPYGRRIPSSQRTKTYEVVLVNGQRYRKLVARNGEPLTPAEKWEIEEDIKRQKPVAKTSLRELAQTHQLALEGNVLRATRGDKTLTFRFDPQTYTILEQTTESATSRMTLEYRRLEDGTTLPERMTVDFVVNDVHGLQISTFRNFTANW